MQATTLQPAISANGREDLRDIQVIWNELKIIRDPYVNRALKYSKFTVRALMATTDSDTGTGSSELALGYNTLGPQLVSHLANKYMMALFPPHTWFAKLSLDEDVKKTIVKGKGNPQGIDPAELEYKLSRIEKQAKQMMDRLNARPALLEALKHLICIGNCLLYFPDRKHEVEGKAQVYALDEYVLRRDLSGNLIEIITLDKKALVSLPIQVQEQVVEGLKLTSGEDIRKKVCDLYTHVQAAGPGKWLVRQAIENINIGTPQQITTNQLRWVPLRWNSVRREVFGRGHVEDYAPIFHALEVLNEALVTGAAITLDFKFLVDPSSMVDVQFMNDSKTGTYHFGRKGDVALVDKAMQGDITAINQLVGRFEAILKQAFLWNTPRDSERTTAEEIRLMANELETSHGGVFGALSTDLQQPLAKLMLNEVDTKIGKSPLEAEIITGLDALGRGNINEAIKMVFQDMATTLQVPSEVLQLLGINWTALFKVMCAGRGAAFEDFVYTEDEIKAQAETAQKQQAETAKQEAALNNTKTPQEAMQMPRNQ